MIPEYSSGNLIGSESARTPKVRLTLDIAEEVGTEMQVGVTVKLNEKMMSLKYLKCTIE